MRPQTTMDSEESELDVGGKEMNLQACASDSDEKLWTPKKPKSKLSAAYRGRHRLQPLHKRVCAKCGFVFTRSSSLLVHQRRGRCKADKTRIDVYVPKIRKENELRQRLAEGTDRPNGEEEDIKPELPLTTTIQSQSKKKHTAARKLSFPSPKRSPSNTSQAFEARNADEDSQIKLGKTGPAGRFRCGHCPRRFGYRHNLWRHVRTDVACDEHRKYRLRYGIPLESGDEYDEQIFPGTDPTPYNSQKEPRSKPKRRYKKQTTLSDSDEYIGPRTTSKSKRSVEGEAEKPEEEKTDLSDYDCVLLEHVRLAYINSIYFPHFLHEIRPEQLALDCPEQFDILLSQFTLMATMLKAGILEYNIPHMGDISLRDRDSSENLTAEESESNNDNNQRELSHESSMKKPRIDSLVEHSFEHETNDCSLCAYCRAPIPFVEQPIVSACFAPDCINLFHTGCAPHSKEIVRHDGTLAYYCADCPHTTFYSQDYAQL